MSHKRESSFTGQCPESLKTELESLNVEVKQYTSLFVISTTDPQALNNAFKLLNEHEVKSIAMPSIAELEEEGPAQAAVETDNDKQEAPEPEEVVALRQSFKTKKDAVAYAQEHGYNVDESLKKEEYINELIVQVLLGPPAEVVSSEGEDGSTDDSDDALEMGEGLSLESNDSEDGQLAETEADRDNINDDADPPVDDDEEAEEQPE